MCHDPSSRPPVFGPPSVAVASAAPLTLTADDGTHIGAFHAVPALPIEAQDTSVLMLPDNRGLSGFYEDLCVRLAEQGHPALAVDYFGRTDGSAPRSRSADFPFMEHLLQLTRDSLFQDIRAGIAALRTAPAVSVATLGFCFGGRQAFLTADPAFGVSAAIGFYGFPGELFGAPGPTQLAAGFTAPVLGLFGGADTGITADHVAAFDAALGAVEHEIVTYPGMPHSFFDIPGEHTDPDTGAAAHAEACADAWRRVLRRLSPSRAAARTAPPGPGRARRSSRTGY
jgi:carboxymethylenebutenolidase